HVPAGPAHGPPGPECPAEPLDLLRPDHRRPANLRELAIGERNNHTRPSRHPSAPRPPNPVSAPSSTETPAPSFPRTTAMAVQGAIATGTMLQRAGYDRINAPSCRSETGAPDQPELVRRPSTRAAGAGGAGGACWLTCPPSG